MTTLAAKPWKFINSMLAEDNFKRLRQNGFNWWWPTTDTKLAQVFHHKSDIDLILDYVDDFSLCVQAGGAVGVWPIEFAKHFELVCTFEPDPTNYECLKRNVAKAGKVNIIHRHAALGETEKKIHIVRDECHVDNCGAGYAVEGGDTDCITIDGLGLRSCGLIQLDIEGYEINALRGATETIESFRPVIVLEVKPHPQLKGRKEYLNAEKFLLEQMGYTLTAAFNRDRLYTRC